jgi:hypothetical protein
MTDHHLPWYPRAMVRSLALATLLLAATQVSALSCVVPDPAETFRLAQESPDRFLVLHGTLSADPAAFVTDDTDPAPDPHPVPGTFSGRSLTLDGFTRDQSGPITLQPTCAASWCGGFPGTGPVLAFARIAPSGLELELDACSQWVFPNPSQAALDLMAHCVRAGACPAP